MNHSEHEQQRLPSSMRVLDVTNPPLQGDILVPFAIDDLVCAEVGQGKAALLHLWTHEQALVVGLRDSKLPYAKETIEALNRSHCHTAVRHSGGAAVPLDAGVLNVSLILPKLPGAMNFRHDFERMVQLLSLAAQSCGVELEQGEIKGSYCPGDYDLSVRGKKIAGLAQRRQTRAIAIQAFIVVEGVGEERVRRAQAFYEQAVGPDVKDDKGHRMASYPKVESGTVVSLQELQSHTLTVTLFKQAILEQLQHMGVELESVSREAWLGQSHVTEAAEMIRRKYTP